MAQPLTTRFLPVEHSASVEATGGPDLESFLCQRFRQPHCLVTPLGRTAIELVLNQLGLGREDEVFLTTTFDLPNVSSCVTCTIFNVCKPSRALSEATRALFVIHEFGVPHPRLRELRDLADQRGLPLIEDCAHTLDSRLNGTLVGTVGDYTVLSFPKIFAVASGGALLGPAMAYPPHATEVAALAGIRRAVAPCLDKIEEYSVARRRVFRQLAGRVRELGLQPLFEPDDDTAPWFFPLRLADWRACLEASRRAGVECAHWHGSDVVVFPCHQYLSQADVDAIAAVADQVATAAPAPDA